jgi:hypothetical protein
MTLLVILAKGTHQSTTLMGPKAGIPAGEEHLRLSPLEVPAFAGMTVSA